MFGWSPITIIVILLIVFLIFGAGKLPEIGSGLGKALKNFKNSIAGKDEIDVTPNDSENDESLTKPQIKQISRVKKQTATSVRKTKRTPAKTVKTVKNTKKA